MNKIYLSLLALSVFAIISCGEKKSEEKDVKADESSKTEETSETIEENVQPVDSATAMKNWMDYMTPGDMHKMMASHDGKWNEEITMWMAPDSPPTKSTGTAVNKMIMGGRYQESTHTGSFDGMPFEGKSTLAYDNATKTFKSTWIDNMGTGIMVMDGIYDEATKTINFSGMMIDPMTGQETKVRETFTIIDENTQKMEMFCSTSGKEYKNMEIVFTRKK
jgi:hypothetical protein